MLSELHMACQSEFELTDHQNTNLNEQITAQFKHQFTRMPLIVIVVIAILLVIHGFLQISGQSIENFATFAFAFIPARFANHAFPQLQGSAYWSMLSYGFLHADWTHVIFNSAWLLIFSKPVVLRLGSLRYLVLLAISVIAGAIGGLIVHWGEFVVMIGMSAGVSGMIAAAIPIMYAENFHVATVSKPHMHQLVPLTLKEIMVHKQALAFTAMWVGLTVFTATSQYLTGTAFLEERVVAWEAHVGGFIAGFVAFYLLDKTRGSLKAQ
jgi:membrane associated rhomboid family serine protease